MLILWDCCEVTLDPLASLLMELEDGEKSRGRDGRFQPSRPRWSPSWISKPQRRWLLKWRVEIDEKCLSKITLKLKSASIGKIEGSRLCTCFNYFYMIQSAEYSDHFENKTNENMTSFDELIVRARKA
jgi:hypothetical protein